MILPDELIEAVKAEISEHPDSPLEMPDWCYMKGRDVVKITVGRIDVLLHRWLYEQMIEPLDGRTLRNVSGVPRNVNPYLFKPSKRKEPPPPKKRKKRTVSPLAGTAAVNASKTHCPEGHEYTPENTIRRPSDNGRRRCATCERARSLARYRAGRSQAGRDLR